MTCDECKERVLELVEREAFDPEGVREALARCPECRALFEEMKGALELADELPREEPPAEVDAAILRAARARHRRVTPRKRRLFRSPEWAVAAVALLAVGVGVWAIPRYEEARPAAELAAPETALAPKADRASGDEGSAARPSEVSFEDRPSTEEEAAPPAARRVAAEPASRPSRPRVQKRRSRADARDEDAASTAAPPRVVAESAALAGARGGANVADAEKPEALREAKKEAPGELSSKCARRIARVERQGLNDDLSRVAPEEALAIGECYRAAGELGEAKRWLERAALDAETKERATRALRELRED